jgi:disulfide oxidoreductase YuzD
MDANFEFFTQEWLEKTINKEFINECCFYYIDPDEDKIKNELTESLEDIFHCSEEEIYYALEVDFIDSNAKL